VRNEWNPAWSKERLAAGAALALLLLLATNSRWMAVAQPDGLLAAKVNLTTLQSYKGSPLPRPDKILVYDLVPDTDIQVDKSQRLRPRHLIAGDENPDAIARKSEGIFSEELAKKLAKTGIPVQYVTADTAPSDNSLMVQGTFVSLREGDKTQRVTAGLGSAQVQTKIDVRLKISSEAVLVSQFQTETTTAKNVGAAVPVAAGLNPAGVATKSVVTDRRKTLNRDISKTADASAKEIMKLMADQGWIKLNDKGEVVP
jgi:Domain of unknown function (DUF4410)